VTLLLWPTALGIGIILGMFGAGGGMVTVPALIYFADMPVKQAIGMSLWIVTLVSFVALVHQRVWKCLQWKLVVTLGLSGIVGSVSGSIFAQYLPEQLQLGLFTALIFAVTWWVSKIKLADRIGLYRFVPATVTGFAIGILTGVFGVGGGFLLVPALIYLGISHFPVAVAHSLVLISLNALAGGISYLGQIEIPIFDTFIFALIASMGTVIGTYLLKRVPGHYLQKSFSIILVLMGIFMSWRTLTM